MKFYNVGLRRKLNIKVEGRTDIRIERERKKKRMYGIQSKET